MADNKIKLIQNEISETTHIMKQNIDVVLERGEKIETLQEKTQQLEKDANTFQKISTKLKRSMCIKNAKMTAIIIAIFLIIFLIIFAIIYTNVKSKK